MKVKVGTKEKIFNIAQSLFIERGYNNTSLRDITQKAESKLSRCELSLWRQELTSTSNTGSLFGSPNARGS